MGGVGRKGWGGKEERREKIEESRGGEGRTVESTHDEKFGEQVWKC